MRYQGFANSNEGEYTGGAGVGFLRVVLLFGSAAVALGLILIPLLMQRGDKQLTDSLFVAAPNAVITGSIKPDSGLTASETGTR